MKKFIIIFIIVLIITGCNNKEDIQTIMSYGEYKQISVNNVKTLIIKKYTEAGMNQEKITNKKDIKLKYNYLNSYRIGKETDLACQDDSVIYQFTLNTKTISIEIECGNIVLNNKRYELIKNKKAN